MNELRIYCRFVLLISFLRFEWRGKEEEFACEAKENDTFDEGRAGESNKFMNETRFHLEEKFVRFINFVMLAKGAHTRIVRGSLELKVA